MTSNASHPIGSPRADTLIALLRNKLPSDLWDQIPWIAHLIVALASGEVTPTEAQAQLLANQNYPAIQRALPEEEFTIEGLRLHFGLNTISVGDITDSQAVAIGHGAVAVSLVLQPVFKSLPPDFRMRVSRIINEYDEVFGGRSAELTMLDSFLTQEDKTCALLLAPTGRGKTALLINWLSRVHQRDDWLVVFVPISVRFKNRKRACDAQYPGLQLGRSP